MELIKTFIGVFAFVGGILAIILIPVEIVRRLGGNPLIGLFIGSVLLITIMVYFKLY